MVKKMNYWLYRAELKEIAEEFMNLFRGRTFLSSDMILEYFDSNKSAIYAKHPKIAGKLDFHLEIGEQVPGKSYWVSSVTVEDPDWDIP